MRKAKAIYTEPDIAKEWSSITCVLAETQRQAQEWEIILVGNKEAFGYVLIGDRGHREASGRLLRGRASCMIWWGAYLAFSLVGPLLEVRMKIRISY